MGCVTSYGTKGTELAATFHDRLYRADGSKRGVVFCHGLNGQGWNPVHFRDPVIDELAARGHCVISPDLGGQATWGNDTAQTKIADARTYLQGTMGAKAGGVLLWCGSMGALAGLNFQRANPTLVSAVAIGLPAIDLADLHDNRGFGASIDTAYGGGAGYTAGLAAHSPALNAAAYRGTPVKMWYSADDTVVPPAITVTFANAAGLPATSMGNQGGHTFGAVYARDVADFLTSFN